MHIDLVKIEYLTVLKFGWFDLLQSKQLLCDQVNECSQGF